MAIHREQRRADVGGVLDEFEKWLLRERSAQERTAAFVEWLPAPVEESLHCLSAATVIEWVNLEAARGLKASTLGKQLVMLRSFLQYCHRSRRTSQDLSGVVPHAAAWRLSSIPDPVPAGTIEALFGSLDLRLTRSPVLAAVAAAAGTRLGITINWARSAIEGRSPDTAVRHIESARTAGVLSGVMFAGCPPVATDFGYPWIDAHLPTREVEGAPNSSLLTADRIRESVVAAGPVDYLGLKIGLRPASLGVEAQVARLATMAKDITESAAARND